jgi:sphingolipid delta-4 desaturase
MIDSTMAPPPRGDFFRATTPIPHGVRAKRILAEHPDVRRFIGRNPRTFWITFGIVVFQVAVAWLLRGSPWWVILLAGALVGAFADHALWVIIHECTHNLVFRTPPANMFTGMLANLPIVVPSFVSFARYHMKHHAHLGVYDHDPDVPNRWEAKIVGHSSFMKTVWLILFPFMQLTRPPRLKELKPIDRWMVLNFIVQMSFNVAVWVLISPGALGYLFASFYFSIGAHPLGARWIQEHYVLFPEQETNSYYGWLNRFQLNIGYHNEHHDFPSVPWNLLPELKKTAPEAYETLRSHPSWARLTWQFITDSRISLYRRNVRPDRGDFRLAEELPPESPSDAAPPSA